MGTVWNEDDRRRLLERMDQVSPPRTPRWGTMTAEQMVKHVTAQLELSLGILEVRSRRNWLGRWPMRHILIHWAPWPKGAPTAPELIRFSDAHWEEARTNFKRNFDRVVARGPSGEFAPHPFFGKLSTKTWGVLMYRHMDHHLRQFGV